MAANQQTTVSKDIKSTASLSKVLRENKHVKDLVEECAEDLSSVTQDLSKEIIKRDHSPAVQQAKEKSEIVETKVQEVAVKLTDVNQALEHELKLRHSLEDRLAVTSAKEEKARHAAFHDALTGLPNRALFHDRLEHGLAQAKRHGRSFAVLFMDLNAFKSINDTHGHEAGDKVLQLVAERLKCLARQDDTISRHGGDEFLYLLMEAGSEREIQSIVEKLIVAVREPLEIRAGEENIHLNVGASVGISIYPQHGTTAETLLRNADKAMYLAKRNNTGYSFAQ
jgi:diguanylate cyclase (GGDEF)-like protein